MRISILLNSDGSIGNINTTGSDAAMRQSSLDGSIVVEADSTFNVDESYKWSIRPEDNVLVHKDTNQTPEEEKDAVITQLTLQNLQKTNGINELKKFSTAQTLKSLQDEKDKEELRKVGTDLTLKYMELENKISSSDITK